VSERASRNSWRARFRSRRSCPDSAPGDVPRRAAARRPRAVGDGCAARTARGISLQRALSNERVHALERPRLQARRAYRTAGASGVVGDAAVPNPTGMPLVCSGRPQRLPTLCPRRHQGRKPHGNDASCRNAVRQCAGGQPSSRCPLQLRITPCRPVTARQTYNWFSKVSQSLKFPAVKPRLNHCARCAADPWVQVSG